MSWFSKVAWKEGLFLQPHHLQQNDRYVEKLVEGGVIVIEQARIREHEHDQTHYGQEHSNHDIAN